ncbi:MAG: hypothetical protein WDN26_17730 [Chitinophagaceae bacterium]
MISTKPDFQRGGIVVTLLVPNIYTQHDVFEMLNELRVHTNDLLGSLNITDEKLYIEYETISESDAAFMGYQQTHSSNVKLSNGEVALVIDCGKGTTDISMVLADDNENYSSFSERDLQAREMYCLMLSPRIFLHWPCVPSPVVMKLL